MAGGSARELMQLPPHLHAFRSDSLWLDKTIGDCSRDLAMARPDMLAFLGEAQPATHASLLADAEALTAALNELGVRKGDVIAFQLPNWLEAAVINLAAALGGFVISPIVTIYRDAEVRQMLRDSGACVFFFAETFRGFSFAEMAARIGDELPDLRHRIVVRSDHGGLPYASLLESGRSRPCLAPKVDPDSLKLLLFTSGTTGTPKAVMHSHNTLARVARVSYDHWDIRSGDVVLMPSPVTHISGYSNGLEQPFLTGTQTVLMESWNAEAALERVDRHAVAATVAATPFLKELADLVSRKQRRLPSLRVFACGGAAVPAQLVSEANAAFANPCAFRVYGSSEVPLVTLGCSPVETPELAAGTDGAPADYEVRIVDDLDRNVERGMEGEILARGPAMFLGYADPEQTREALTSDGFFRTGDIGLLTAEGAIRVTGRKKDLIIRGGENISAKEIEDVLSSHPAVQEAAVVSMPHPRLGEGICAFVIGKGESDLGKEALAAHVAAAGLAKQKYPERVEIVSDLPRTASGKVRKDLLRENIRALIEQEKTEIV